MTELEEKIFNIRNEAEFESLALEIFQFQAGNNAVYAEFLANLGMDSVSIQSTSEIPFLPIELFKNHRVLTGKGEPDLIFESSGTTGQTPSRHFVLSETLYRQSFLKTFTQFYGPPEELCILALLPSYLERGNSSLVYMMDHLINLSGHQDSGFYLDDLKKLSEVLQSRITDGHPTLLLGVSFALLDLAEKYPVKLTENITIMETGGMKGRRKEMVREELHKKLREAFQTAAIHSEYGMTELLSQAYSKNGHLFNPPPWMKVLVRDLYDPMTLLPEGRSGGINIIDLANLYSCSFIATGDVGKTFSDDSFEITGRFDQAEVRGCNLMVV